MMKLSKIKCAVMCFLTALIVTGNNLVFAASGDWQIDNVLDKSANKLKGWGGKIMIVLGVVLIVVGIWKIAAALMSHGKRQVNWAINIALILVGALFCLGSQVFEKLAGKEGESGSDLGLGINKDLQELGKTGP